MPKIVAVHSFRGGTGKSNIIANVAVLLALEGKRVAVLDMDLAAPGIHTLFGITANTAHRSLNDYLWGRCTVSQCAHDLTRILGSAPSGKLFVVPASMDPAEITRVLREGYDVGLLNDGFHHLIASLMLDMLIIDTHPGVQEETLLSVAVSDTLAIVLRPDAQDYEGTGILVDMMRKMDVPRALLIVNKAPQALNHAEIKQRVERSYQCDVAGLLPHCDEIMTLASSGVFALRYPDHALTASLREVAHGLAA